METIKVILDNNNNDETTVSVPKDSSNIEIIKILNDKFTENGWWCYE